MVIEGAWHVIVLGIVYLVVYSKQITQVARCTNYLLLNDVNLKENHFNKFCRIVSKYIGGP